jgi:hypothetical protein
MAAETQRLHDVENFMMSTVGLKKGFWKKMMDGWS